MPSRKSDQDISKSDSYQTIYLPKMRLKADPNLISSWSKSDLFHKLTINIKSGLYINNTHSDFHGCTSRISLSISVNFTILRAVLTRKPFKLGG